MLKPHGRVWLSWVETWGLSYQTWLHALPSQLRVAAESLGASELDSQGPSSSPPHSTPRGCICSSGTRGNPRQLAWLLEACFRVERTLGSDLSAPAALRPAPLDGCRRCQRGDVASRPRGGLGWALGQPGLHILEAWIFVWGQTWKSAPELSVSGGCACSPGSTHGGPGQWWVMQWRFARCGPRDTVTGTLPGCRGQPTCSAAFLRHKLSSLCVSGLLSSLPPSS